MEYSYKKAGVDTDAIKKSQMEIERIIKSTHGGGVAHGFGHYAGIVRVGMAKIATHTDGVGTKVLIANAMKKYDTVGIDCVAMNVNDIVCVGAKPVAFVDYIASSENNQRIFADITKGLAAGALEAGVPIVGGETAVMPDLFAGSGFMFDLAGTVTGAIHTTRNLLGGDICKNDCIIGAASSGLHSNGYTLARAVLKNRKLSEKYEGRTIGEWLIEPTRIYAKPVLEIISKTSVNGLAHITGGSFTKLTRLKNMGYHIDSLPEMPPIMGMIKRCGVAEIEMYKTFNMGVGFCIISPERNITVIQRILKKYKIDSSVIGNITTKKGVFVNSRRIA